MQSLDSIAAYRLEVPLTKPYRLSFGAVERYDTIVLAATDTDGRSGFGEATVLTGYTDETIDDAWRVAREFAQRIVTEAQAVRARSIRELAATHPFTATAFGTAFEMLERGDTWAVTPRSIPLVGLLDAKGEDAIAAEFDALYARGYRTIKIKVGFDVENDAAFVGAVQRAARGRALIRVDANQGYTAEQGIAFVRALEPDGIELFEQPCAAGDWNAHLQVARAAGVPLMLDESIYGLEDIEKAASLQCAQFIKVKLMKFVTLEALVAAIRRIRALGMKPVLGNGVACDPGCWLEAIVAAEEIDNAGELNGFLKIGASLLDPPLTFEDGAIRLSAVVPRLNMNAIERYAIDSCRVSATAAAHTSI